MKTLSLLILAVAGVIGSSAFGCVGNAVPGRETRPQWQAAAADSSRLVYLVERVSDRLAAVTFRNLCDQELRFCFALNAAPSSQASQENVGLQPGAQSRFEFKVDHFLNAYFLGSVDVWNVREGNAQLASQPRPASLPIPHKAGAEMYAVYPLEETTTFNPGQLPCLIARQPDGKVAVNFRNDSRRTIHFDFRIAGFQDAGAKNPRVTLCPGMEAELPMSIENSSDATIESALVEVYNIRIGKDSGPLISPEREEAAPRRGLPNGATYLPWNDTVEFNNRTLCTFVDVDSQRHAKIRILNLGDSAVFFDPLIVGKTWLEGNLMVCKFRHAFLDQSSASASRERVERPRVSIAAGEEISLEGIDWNSDCPPQVFIRKLRLGIDAGLFIGEVNEPRLVSTEEGWLPVSAGAPLFNPKTIGYGLAGSADTTTVFNPKSIGYGVAVSESATTVQFVNFTDTPLQFDFRLPGYQDENISNSRMTLAPWQRRARPVEVEVKVDKKDGRLSFAKVQVFNLRIGGKENLPAEKLAQAETR